MAVSSKNARRRLRSRRLRRAAECLRLAREATDKTNKALLIEMAQTWAKLAKQDKVKSEDEKPD
jgi:hypothetical protein